MRNRLLYILFLVAFAACQQDDMVEVPRDNDFSLLLPTDEIRGRMRVKFESMERDLDVVVTRAGEAVTGDSELDEAMGRIGAVRMRRVFPYAGKFEARTRAEGLHLWYDVVYDERVSTREAMEALEGVANVKHVEPVYEVRHESEAPYNDPGFKWQWHLYNDGSNGMLLRADIKMKEAWEIEKGDPSVIVNIVDTPVDFNHEDLRANMWINPGEMNYPTDLDNDGNGYVGDWFGFYQVQKSDDEPGQGVNPYIGDKYTPNSHGTHIAGIIAAKNNNGVGVCGIAGGDTRDNGVRIMTTKSPEPASIKYGADNGAVLCNCSWYYGVEEPNAPYVKVFQDAVNYFTKYAGVDEKGNQTGPMRGGLVVASAGNDNAEFTFRNPAALDNVVAVANIGPQYRKSSTSCWGNYVDMAAPGGTDGVNYQIYSTYPDNSYEWEAGTSMAAPMVVGVAALIISKYGGPGSGLTPATVEARLKQTATPIDEYNPEYAGKLGAGCVNAYAALQGDKLNFAPEVTPDTTHVFTRLKYGEKTEFVFHVNDKEDGADVTCELEDASGAVTLAKEGGKVTLSVVNRDCETGIFKVNLIVTDKEGASVEASVSFQLHPELRQEVEIPSTVTDVLPIRASMTFSGNVKAQLYDAAGNLVLEERLTISLSEAGELSLAGVDGGAYTLKLTCNNKTITKNIIKL